MDRNPQDSDFGGCLSIQELILRVRAVLHDRILRIRQVSKISGRGESTIWGDVAKGIFPGPIRLGPRAVGWRESEIQAWIEARSISSRSQVPIDMKKFVAMLTASKDMGVEHERS